MYIGQSIKPIPETLVTGLLLIGVRLGTGKENSPLLTYRLGTKYFGDAYV